MPSSPDQLESEGAPQLAELLILSNTQESHLDHWQRINMPKWGCFGFRESFPALTERADTRRAATKLSFEVEPQSTAACTAPLGTRAPPCKCHPLAARGVLITSHCAQHSHQDRLRIICSKIFQPQIAPSQLAAERSGGCSPLRCDAAPRSWSKMLQGHLQPGAEIAATHKGSPANPQVRQGAASAAPSPVLFFFTFFI